MNKDENNSSQIVRTHDLIVAIVGWIKVQTPSYVWSNM